MAPGDTVETVSQQPGTNETTVTLLTYNDIQTAAAKTGNLPRLASVIEKRTAAHDNPVLVMGAGDELSPHALSPVSAWRSPVDVLNAIGTDAETLGNHDLDYGTDGFANASEASQFPWVATNLVNTTTGEPIDGAKRYTVVERQGVRVGVLGVTHDQMDSSVSADLAAQNITVTPTLPAIERYSSVLRNRENVDAIVVLMHDGVPKAKEVARKTDVDAVITAHDETTYGPKVIENTIVSEARARATHVGEINLTVRNGEVVAMEGRLINTSTYPKDTEVASIIEGYRSEVNLDSAVTTSEVKLDARFSTNYHRESNYGNLVADAMRKTTDADLAITNAGGIRSNAQYGPGEITGGDVFNTLPFGNTVVVVNMTGAEIKEALASQVVTLNSYIGQQYGAEISQQVSGVSFDWLPHEDRGPTIRDVYVNGEPLDPDAHYEVAVNSYIAGGGSSYPLADEPRVERTGKLLATTVIDYLEGKQKVAPKVVGRMRRVTAVDQAGNARLDGEGVTVVRVDVPATAQSVDDDTWRATVPGTTETVEPSTKVEVDGKTWLYFSDAKLQDLAVSGTSQQIEIFVDYTDRRYDDEWVYWDGAVLNVEVNAIIPKTPYFAPPRLSGAAANAPA